MDVSDASYYIQENNENRGSQMGHTKKIFFKKLWRFGRLSFKQEDMEKTAVYFMVNFYIDLTIS